MKFPMLQLPEDLLDSPRGIVGTLAGTVKFRDFLFVLLPAILATPSVRQEIAKIKIPVSPTALDGFPDENTVKTIPFRQPASHRE